MKIFNETIRYIAELSKLEVPSEKDGIIDELGAFVGYMEILNQLDTDGVEPLSHIFPIKNIMREDVAVSSFDRALILENAPSNNEEYFIVPKTVEG